MLPNFHLLNAFFLNSSTSFGQNFLNKF